MDRSDDAEETLYAQIHREVSDASANRDSPGTRLNSALVKF